MADPKMQLTESQKNLRLDADHLLQLAKELKEEAYDAEQTKVLSLSLIHKAEEVEKLAKHIKDLVRAACRMGFQTHPLIACELPFLELVIFVTWSRDARHRYICLTASIISSGWEKAMMFAMSAWPVLEEFFFDMDIGPTANREMTCVYRTYLVY